MENYWVKGVSKKLRKITDARVEREVVIVRGEEKEFMNSYLNEVQEKENIHFKASVSTRKYYNYYACERASKATGGSKGDSQKTRANSCQAYISFTFMNESGFKGAVIHKMLQHTGHNVSNPEEGIKNRIDPELLAFVEMWLTQGCSISETLLKSCDWAHRHGHADKNNRRYFLNPEDVRLLKKTLHGLNFPNCNDSVSVDHLVTSELKENICFYQPLTNQQPLIVVVQTPSQKKLLEENLHPIVFMDASYKGITAYGYAFYSLLLINATGRGVPFAYFIVSQESTETLSLCLQKLHLSNPCFYPRSVMIDRDLKELTAIKNVLLMPRFSFVGFMYYRWLVKTDGGHLTGAQRNVVTHAMVSMKACLTEEEFLSVSADKCSEIDTYLGSTHVTTYLKTHWFPYAELWVNFGRTFFHFSSETNNKAERFFLTLKYQFLRRQANKRVDQLLRLLCGDVAKYYSYMDDLAEAGRLKVSNSSAVAAAAAMCEKGLGKNLNIDGNGKCSVKSESGPNCYTVDLVYFLCDCNSFKMGNLCKHIILSKTEAQRRGMDIERMRNTEAEKMINCQLYQKNDDHVTIFHSDGSISVVRDKTAALLCTCKANSHREKCLCIHVVNLLKAHELPELPTDSSQHVAESQEPQTEKELSIQAMLSDLQVWSHSDSFTPSQDLYEAVQRAHKLAFSTFTKVSKKRKIVALHAYRQRMNRTKNENFKLKRRRRTHNRFDTTKE